MQVNDIKKFLTLAGHTDALAGFVRIKELWVIDLDTDGNQFYTPSSQKIWFDCDSETMKIKYSILTSASAFINKFKYDLTNKYVDIATDIISGSPYYNDRKFRYPKINDKFCSYDTVSKGTPYASTITGVAKVGDRCRLYLDTTTALDNMASGHSLAFFILRGDKDSILVDNIPAKYYTEEGEDSFATDIYVGFDKISSLDFDKQLGIQFSI
jgi:hypothetical protein